MLRNIKGERQLDFGRLCYVVGQKLEVMARRWVEVLGSGEKVDSHTPGIDVLEDREALEAYGYATRS
jgi:hypothetical protein